MNKFPIEAVNKGLVIERDSIDEFHEVTFLGITIGSVSEPEFSGRFQDGTWNFILDEDKDLPAFLQGMGATHKPLFQEDKRKDVKLEIAKLIQERFNERSG